MRMNRRSEEVFIPSDQKTGYLYKKKGTQEEGQVKGRLLATFPLLSSEFNVLTLIQVKCLEGEVSTILKLEMLI